MSDAFPAYDASRHLKAGRGKIYPSIVETIGDTPIVGLPRLSAEMKPKATVLAPTARRERPPRDSISRPFTPATLPVTTSGSIASTAATRLRKRYPRTAVNPLRHHG